jgi:hypothetical protein
MRGRNGRKGWLVEWEEKIDGHFDPSPIPPVEEKVHPVIYPSKDGDLPPEEAANFIEEMRRNLDKTAAR